MLLSLMYNTSSPLLRFFKTATYTLTAWKIKRPNNIVFSTFVENDRTVSALICAERMITGHVRMPGDFFRVSSLHVVGLKPY
jgi:cytidine deaminase